VALGLSCSARRLTTDHDELVDAVHDVARWASEQWAGEGRPPAALTGRPDGSVAAEDVADDEDRLVSGPRR